MSRNVCRYWQQGYCRFGESCKFVHLQPQQSTNRFSALSSGFGGASASSNNNNTMAASRPAEAPFSISKENIRKDLVEERPHWILSAYGPGKDAPEQLFGGYPREQSFEEVHLHYVEGLMKGNAQGALNDISALYQTAEQQIQTVLRDLDGAMKFVLDAQNRTPNRFTICQQASSGQPKSGASPFGGATASPFQKPANAFGSTPAQPTAGAFGQTGVLGQRPSPFGVGARGAVAPAFGQPAALGAANPGFGQPAFGQASLPPKPNPFGSGGGALGQASGALAFGQPSQPGSAFGQTSALGQKPNPFGAPASGASPFGNESPFGQTAPAAAAQPATQSPFGPQPNQVQQGSTVFGQAAAPVAQAGPFSQPSRANPFGDGQQAHSQAQAPHGFGQPATAAVPSLGAFGAAASPPAAMGFGAAGAQQAASTPFAQAQNTAMETPPGTATGIFGSTAKSSPFGLPSSTAHPLPGTTVASASAGLDTAPAAAATTQAAFAPAGLGASRRHPPVESYSSRGPPTRLAPAGQLTMFKGRAVQYQPLGKDANKPNAMDFAQPTVRLPNGTAAKVWFPDGAPPYTPDTELAGPQRAKYDDERVKKQWKPFLETGRFPRGGPMPEEPPLREWCSWEF